MGKFLTTSDISNEYFSDLTGLYILFALVASVYQLQIISAVEVEVGFNYLKIIYMSLFHYIIFPIQTKHADIIMSIRKIRSMIPITIIKI